MINRLGFGLLILAGAAFALTFLIWRPFTIPAGSMKPTLQVGDYVLVTRFHGTPAVGQVAVFKHPVTDHDFIKRIVAMPGDTVQMVDGQLVLNNTPVPQIETAPFVEVMTAGGPFLRCANGTVGIGADCLKWQYTETLPNGVSYNVLDVGDVVSDATGVYTVPEAHFFVLGDHRDNSTDSRMSPQARGVGFVPIENYVGRADLVLFSTAGSRFLKAVQ